MTERTYKPAKPYKAGKNYRPKGDIRHVFFFKGYYIIISQNFKDVWVCERTEYFSTNYNKLDSALVQAMEKVYELKDQDYQNELQKISKQKKEKEIKKQLEPYINILIEEIKKRA